MKPKRKHLLTAIMLTTSISAVTQADSLNNRASAKHLEHGGWPEHQVGSTVVNELQLHDDVVGVRNDGGVELGNNSNPQLPTATNPNKQNAPINCENPLYQELCAQLAKLTEQEKPVGEREWVKHWSGKTTGGVSVPNTADEVFIKYIVGHRSKITKTKAFPAKTGAFTIDSITKNWTSNSQKHNRSCSATVTLSYSSFKAKVTNRSSGQSTSNCAEAIYITSMMYR